MWWMLEVSTTDLPRYVMNRFKIYHSIYFSAFLALLSCRNMGEVNSLTINFQRISFPSINLNELKYRVSHYNYKQDIFAGIDFKSGTLEVWHLNAFRFAYQLPIFEDGPNRISEHLLTVYVHGPDSIFLITLQDLIIIDQKGSIVFKLPFNFENTPYQDLMVHYNPTLSQMSYYSSNKRSFFFSSRTANPNSEYLYNRPVVSSINLLSKEIRTDYPVCPKEIAESFVLPFAETVVNVFEDKLVYSFFGTSTLWVYDLQANSTNTYAYKEFKNNLPNKHFGFNFGSEANKHASSAINYLCLGYNSKTKLFLRQIVDNSERQATGRAKSSVAIFDQDLNLIGTRELEQHCSSTFYPYKEGFALKIFRDSSENQSDYLYISVN